MPNKVLTVFQKLEKTLGGEWKGQDLGNATSTQVGTANDLLKGDESAVIYRTDNKEDYETKKLELRQQKYLNNMWRTTNRSLINNSINGLSAVKMMYRDVEVMDTQPEIGAALDIYAEESTVPNSQGKIVNVYSDSPRIKSIIEDLLVNRLEIQVTAPMIIRALSKYGNQYMFLNINNDRGIIGWRQLPCSEIERIEDGVLSPYSVTYNSTSKGNDGTTFVWMGSESGTQVFRNWQIAHFRMITDSSFLPYGCSVLHKARRHWRLMSLMEDLLLIYRLERSMERRVYKIYVGAVDEADVYSYVQNIANHIKRTPLVDPMTGQLDLRKNILPVHKDTPIPLLDGRIISIEQLAKEYEEGKENYVYSIQDNTLNLVGGKVVWCGKNYTADKLIKITLDDTSHIILASEHELIMRDGSKKRADEVTEGESVMPFYTNIQPMSKGYKAEYETVYNPHNGKYEFTHRLIAESSVPKSNESYNTVHHKDITNINNRFNNNPTNLEWMNFQEHKEMHRNMITERQIDTVLESMPKSWEGKGRENRIEKMVIHFDDLIWALIESEIINGKINSRATLLDFVNSEFVITHLIKNNPKNKKLANKRSVTRTALMNRLKEKGYDTFTYYLADIVEKNNSTTKIIGKWKKVKGHKGKPIVFNDSIWESMRSAILNGTIKTRREALDYVNNNLIDKVKELSENTSLHKKGKISETKLFQLVQEKYHVSVGQYINDMRKNHKIVKVEWVDGDDAYCMTVEGMNGEQDRHNFAICSWNEDKTYTRNGIFVSNCATDDIFIPTRDPNAPTPIDTLPAGQNLTAIDDIKYIQNKVLAALRIPKAFLNFEETTGDGKNLALMDVRFARVIANIQQAFLMELTKVVTIHLYLLGFTDDLTNFTLTMNNPSTQAEQLEIENLQKKIAVVRDAVSDPGNGIPAMSMIRAWKEIMKYNDSEIKDMLEEIRLEKALAAELEKTSQIIKRTNVFDAVDKRYGEPGAEYQEDNQGGMPNGEGASPLGGGGGGGSFGAGLDNLGDVGTEGEEGEGSINGTEGSIQASDMNGSSPMEQSSSGMTESNIYSLKNNKAILNEHHTIHSNRRTNRNDDSNSSKRLNETYRVMLDKLISRLDEKEKAEQKERTPLYDNTFNINEEYDALMNGLNKILDEK